jgi:hypothetical protein
MFFQRGSLTVHFSGNLARVLTLDTTATHRELRHQEGVVGKANKKSLVVARAANKLPNTRPLRLLWGGCGTSTPVSFRQCCLRKSPSLSRNAENVQKAFAGSWNAWRWIGEPIRVPRVTTPIGLLLAIKTATGQAGPSTTTTTRKRAML